MPSRKQANSWILALRDQLKVSVSSAYRLGEQRGKTKLDVRFQNGTRQLKTLDIAWIPANSSRTKLMVILLELVKTNKKGLKICKEQNI